MNNLENFLHGAHITINGNVIININNADEIEEEEYEDEDFDLDECEPEDCDDCPAFVDGHCLADEEDEEDYCGDCESICCEECGACDEEDDEVVVNIYFGDKVEATDLTQLVKMLQHVVEQTLE